MVVDSGNVAGVATGEHVVRLHIESNLNSFRSERKFAKSVRIDELRSQLELIVGGSAATMALKFKAEGGDSAAVATIGVGCDGDRLLGSYPVDSGMLLFVSDASRNRDEFEDVSRVKKFELTEEQYAKRTDSVRSFMKANRLGRFDAEKVAEAKAERERLAAKQAEAASAISIHDRAEVVSATAVHASVDDAGFEQDMTKSAFITDRFVGQRGVVRYVGRLGKPIEWMCGLELDEPIGVCDGHVVLPVASDGNNSSQTRKLFECRGRRYGVVLPVTAVATGNYPERPIDEIDDSDDDEI